jgi:hypothetical protein
MKIQSPAISAARMPSSPESFRERRFRLGAAGFPAFTGTGLREGVFAAFAGAGLLWGVPAAFAGAGLLWSFSLGFALAAFAVSGFEVAALGSFTAAAFLGRVSFLEAGFGFLSSIGNNPQLKLKLRTKKRKAKN